MAHGAEDQCEFLGVVRCVADLVRHLGHEDACVIRVQTVEGRSAGPDLVAEHEYEGCRH